MGSPLATGPLESYPLPPPLPPTPGVSSVSYQWLFAPGHFLGGSLHQPLLRQQHGLVLPWHLSLCTRFVEPYSVPLHSHVSLFFFRILPVWHLSALSTDGCHPFLNTFLQRCHKLAPCHSWAAVTSTGLHLTSSYTSHSCSPAATKTLTAVLSAGNHEQPRISEHPNPGCFSDEYRHWNDTTFPGYSHLCLNFSTHP